MGFKVGDRVRYVGSFSMHLRDSCGIVTDNDGDEVRVRWDGAGEYGVCFGNIELVAPATSAIRTVTRREIVPGDYRMPREEGPTVRLGPVYKTAVGVNTIAGFGHDHYGMFDATDLRAAAELFNELADVLDENAEAIAAAATISGATLAAKLEREAT